MKLGRRFGDRGATGLNEASERLLKIRALPDEPSSRADLLVASGDPSLHVAREALRRLAGVGGPAEAEVLRQRIWNTDPALVAEFAACIHELGNHGVLDDALERLESSDDDDRSYGDRVVAATVLGEFADPATTPALIRALGDPIGAVRRAALEALRHLPADPDSQAAVLAVLQDSDPQIRAAAVATVAVLDPLAGRHLAELTSDHDPIVRCALARAALKLDGEASQRLLRDEDIRVRELAAEHAGPQATDALESVLHNETSPPVRLAAARRLGEIGRVNATKSLIQSLNDPDSLVRVTVLCSLSHLHDREELLGLLLHALREESRDDRVALLYALRRLNAARECRAELAALVSDHDPEVRLIVAGMARELGEQRLLCTLSEDSDQAVRHAAQTARPTSTESKVHT